MLKLVIPKGSLEEATFQLFDEADLTIKRSSSVYYTGEINDPRILDVKILRPREIPMFVEQGLFDVGITGRDCVEEAGVDVVSLGELQYSKRTAQPVRMVVAVAGDSSYDSPTELPDGCLVATEFPNIAKQYFEGIGKRVEIVMSAGATEAKVPSIADAIVDLSETGRAIRAAGLKIIGVVLKSFSELIANKEAASDPVKHQEMDQLARLLLGVLEARRGVLLKMNVKESALDSVVGLLPSLGAPTISQLYGSNDFAVETVVNRSEVNMLIPQLCNLGAYGIIEVPIRKVVH